MIEAFATTGSCEVIPDVHLHLITPPDLGMEPGQMAVAGLIWWLRPAPVLVRGLVPSYSAVVVLAGAWLLERTLG